MRLCVLNAATHSIHVGIFVVLPAKGAMKTFARIATLFATHVIRFDVTMVIVVWDTARPAKKRFCCSMQECWRCREEVCNACIVLVGGRKCCVECHDD